MYQSHNNPPEPEQPKAWQRLLNKVKSSPKQLVKGAVTIAALGGLGYWGLQALVKQKLPPFLENQIGNIIERPIDLGEVTGFSLNSIQFDDVEIPPTATDSDRIKVEEVKVGFNIFPVLFRRTLPLRATLVNPDIYLEQEADGTWINLDFLDKDPQEEEKKPLVYLDVAADIDQAAITAIPYQQNPIKVQVDGNGRFKQKEIFAQYDLDAQIQQAKATIQGEADLEIGRIDTKLLVDDLSLADAATLLPNSPVNLASGVLNADLDLDIPSWSEITAANVSGMVSLQDVAGEVKDLDQSVTAESQLNFTGRNAEVKQTQGTLGDITAQVAGQVNLDTGYSLDVDVLPFQLTSLPQTITEQLQVAATGAVTAALQLRGAIKDPQLTGTLNNTETVTIAQTSLDQIEADFSANLNQIVLDNLQISPVAGGEIIAQGSASLKQAFAGEQALDLTQIPLELDFQANLPSQELIEPYFQLPQQVGVGSLEAQGSISGTVENPEGKVNWSLVSAGVSEPEELTGVGEVLLAEQKVRLKNTKLNYGEGQANLMADADLASQEWQASLDAQDINLRPFAKEFSNTNLNLDLPLAVDTAEASFNGSLDQLELAQITGTADVNLDVNGSEVTVDSQLNSGNIQARVATGNLPLNPYVSSLPVTASLSTLSLAAVGSLDQLLQYQSNPNLESLQANANLNLLVDGAAVNVDSQVDSGRIQANANTGGIDLQRLVPELPLPAQIQSSRVTATGELKQLITFVDNPSLSSFDAQVDADLNVAQGSGQAIANLRNNQWQADVNLNNVSSKILLEQFAPDNLAGIDLDNINAQANVAGELQPLLDNEVNLPVEVNQVNLSSGAQNLSTKGSLTLSNITSSPDVAAANLDIDANLDFDQLPVAQVVAASVQDNQLISESLNLQGKAEFKGQLQGQQLLSAPVENVELTGDLRLLDFAFNDIVFDPVMTGNVALQPQQELALNLRGQQDVIAASALPCDAADCKLPYLPTNLELRQGEDTSQPVIATGRRLPDGNSSGLGDEFTLDIQNFPLALLNLAPGKALGIEGALAGTTTGNIDLNLDTLGAQGKIRVEQPGLSYIRAEQFSADFNYDPDSNIAEVISSNLDLGNSEYNLNAALDLTSGAIEGKLDIPEAYIQDLLTTLRWFTIEDVISLFNIPDYGTTASVQPQDQNAVDQSIALMLERLRNINSQIQANAAVQEKNKIPTELDLQGKYTGAVILGGTIQTPEADFRIEGNNWQWQPQAPYPDIVPPSEFVIRESQPINLPQILVDGKLQGTTVNLAQASLQVESAVFSVDGQLDPENSNLAYTLADLTVGNISNFVEIPLDINGEIDSQGTITGSLQEPQIAGQLTFADGIFQGNVLPEELAGDYQYNGRELEFNTTAPEAIQVKAQVPYPIIPGKSDRLTASANIEEEAFVFLAALSQNYLNWVGGEGDAELEATARLDLNRPGIIYDLEAQGLVNLDNAEVMLQTPFFSEPFIGTGKITLDNQIVNVESLAGTFAEKDLSATGKLPILTAVNNLDTPLTVDLPPGRIKINDLYQGGVEGQVTVTGASLAPVIGGDVTLSKGRVSIPKVQTPTEDDADDAAQLVKDKVEQATPGTKANQLAQAEVQLTATEPGFITTLDDLNVTIDNVGLRQAFLYDFQAEGDLTLNGTVDDPNNIIPEGTITLTRANVDLFSSSFRLLRNRENTIVFSPDAGVFNPMLDIVLRTQVEDINQQDLRDFQLAETNSNELDDPISQSGSSQTIRISLVIDGETQEILPNLAQTDNLDCDISPADQSLVSASSEYDQAKLDRFSTCFNNSFSNQDSDRDLINSSAVELTSVPNLNQGEIINLLSGQFIASLNGNSLSNRDQSELFDLGVNRFILDPLQSRAFSVLDNTTVSLGRKVGLDYLTVFPNLDAVVEIDQQSAVQSSFNYVLGEFRVQYQRNF
ncbi:MAG: translocation/assembly module TamB domain-containing protein [Cyanobacteria bacterium J06621_8]